MNPNNLIQTISNLNEKIDVLKYLIVKFESKIKRMKNKEIQENCEQFKYHYNKLIGIKRFCIPVFGKISSGKSTFLNYILHLHDVFQTDYNISTKFVCIVRHNPNLNKILKIYNVKVNQRGEYTKNNQIYRLWNFEKDEELIGDVKEIIEKRNHDLEILGYRDSHWEKYFMILEANIPLFKGENSIYSDLFEFMDIPGLNEYSETKNETEHFYYKELLPFFIYNIGFSLYIFDVEKQQSVDSISIINNIMEQYYNNDEKKQKNSIFILNKIDKVKDEENEINNFKKILEDNLKCHIEKEGFFIGLSALLLYLKSFKYESFFDYLFCIIEEKKKDNEIIEEYIIEKMSKDLKTDIEENLEIDSDVKLPLNEKIILQKFNDKITKKGFKGEFSDSNYIYYKKYFDSFSKNKKEDLGIQHKRLEEIISTSFKNNINDFINNFKYDNLSQNLLKELGLNQEDIKILMIRDKNKNIKSSKIDNPIAFVKSFKHIIDKLNEIEPNNPFINQLTQEYNTTLLYMDKEKKIRIPLLGEYSSGKSSLINTLIGNDLNIIPVDTKVCTNIALVIRYTKNISDIALYQTLLEPTTEDYYCFNINDKPIGKGYKVIQEILKLLNLIFSSFVIPSYHQMKIIKYIQKIEDSNENKKIKIISNLTKIINEEILLEDIQDKEMQILLKEIKKDKNKKEINNDEEFYQRAFFLLTVPIEGYDILNLSSEIKEKIELIDFPGLDSANNIFNSNVLGPLLKFSDGFIFVNKGNSIKEKEKVNILFDIIDKIQKRKFEFSFKSCLFLINRCDETEVNIEDCKKEYESLFEINKREQIWNDIISKSEILKNADNINVTKFSNTLYHDFKTFKNRVNNFDSFIEEYEKQIDKKNYQGKKYLLFLKKKIYSADVTSISIEKYKNYNNSLKNTDNLKNYFKKYISSKEDMLIVEDIIKMYLFIKDSIYYSKFYIESNAQDFFDKFKNQLILSKFFYEESLKTLAIKYFLNLNSSFEFMKIKILQDEIDIKFTNEEFIETKKKLENEYKIETKKIKEFIDSTIKSMKKEYDNLINKIQEGNIDDYEISLRNSSSTIEEYKFELESKINDEIPNFRKKLLAQLNFITERLKRIRVNKGNLNSFDLFDSIYDTEKKVFDILGKADLGLLALDLSYLGYLSITAVAAEGIGVAVGEAVGGIFSLTGLVSFGIGAAIGVSIVGAIHGGFKLYKKLVEKKRYIELISNAKSELENSLSNYEKNIDSILKKITDEIKMAVEKFFSVQNVKLDGIKKNMKVWLSLREEIINCLKN